MYLLLNYFICGFDQPCVYTGVCCGDLREAMSVAHWIIRRSPHVINLGQWHLFVPKVKRHIDWKMFGCYVTSEHIGNTSGNCHLILNLPGHGTIVPHFKNCHKRHNCLRRNGQKSCTSSYLYVPKTMHTPILPDEVMAFILPNMLFSRIIYLDADELGRACWRAAALNRNINAFEITCQISNPVSIAEVHPTIFCKWTVRCIMSWRAWNDIRTISYPSNSKVKFDIIPRWKQHFRWKVIFDDIFWNHWCFAWFARSHPRQPCGNCQVEIPRVCHKTNCFDVGYFPMPRDFIVPLLKSWFSIEVSYFHGWEF